MRRLVALALVTSAASAQTVRARIIDDASRRPVAGALVSAFDSARASGPPALSSVDGFAIVRVPSPGTVRLLVRRIGFPPFTSRPIDAAADSTIELIVPSVRVTLAAVRVVAKQQCASEEISPSAGAEPIWNEVRKALESSDVAQTSRAVVTSAITFVRRLNADGVIEGVDTTARSVTGSRPFVAFDPSLLDRGAYVRGDIRKGFDFNGPDERVLLAESFTRLHCVRLDGTRSGPNGATLLALSFQPRRGAEMGDIRGTVLVDSASSELRSITFEYVDPPIPARADSLGGRVELSRLATGVWIVSAWQIRIPRLAPAYTGPQAARGYKVIGYQEIGGSSVEGVALSRTDATPGSIVGLAYDSLGNRPLARATVTLATLDRRALTDSSGRFRLDALPPGRYALWVDHPALDSLGMQSLGANVDVPAAREVQVALGVPPLTELMRRSCRGATPLPNTGFIFGTVSAPGAADPIGAGVSATWHSGNGDAHSASSAAAADGRYAVCGIPTDVRITLRASADVLNSTPIVVTLRQPGLLRRNLTLPTEAALAGDMSTDTAVSATGAERGSGAFLTGTVADSAGAAVAGVRVRVLGAGETRTGANGRFAFRDVAPGTRRILAEGLGFDPVRRVADFQGGDSVSVDIVVRRLTTLETVRVEEKRALETVRADINTRLKLGTGYYVDSSRIASAVHIWATLDMPHSIANMRGGVWRVYFTATSAGMKMESCLATVFINGIIADFEQLNILTKGEIALLEVYPTAARAPHQFAGTRSNCGVIVVWTKGYLVPGSGPGR